MSGRSIDELADAIRAQVGEDWFAAMATVEHLVDGGRLGIDPYDLPDPIRRSVFRWTPQRVIAEVDMKRAMLAQLLAEPHGGECGNVAYDDPCECGRDDRVRGYLELLAGPDEAEAAN